MSGTDLCQAGFSMGADPENRCGVHMKSKRKRMTKRKWHGKCRSACSRLIMDTAERC